MKPAAVTGRSLVKLMIPLSLPLFSRKSLSTSIWVQQIRHKSGWFDMFKFRKQKTSIVVPADVSSPLSVPRRINLPPYAVTTDNTAAAAAAYPILLKPEIKTAEQIRCMRKACAIARKVLHHSAKFIQAGVTTDEIDEIVHTECIRHNAYPSPLKYRGFPKSVCTSVNNVCCHGIPDSRALRDGDIINIDLTVYYNGYHGDTSATYEVGSVDENGRKLIETTEKCLMAAIDSCDPGEYFNVIGRSVSKIASENGFNVIGNLCGHGIGQYFHGPPDVIHVDNDRTNRMLPGMTFTIEPALSEGSPQYQILADGWTAVSLDNSRSAQFEHTVLITDTAVEILTSDNNINDPPIQ
ncbi:methionine aminopeptidase 1D, mitochondrial-like [Tubulanus polymorphus]|uniref:methionine aminopeptidase 1D, mitochondrial-like n=1 Tax=Tubulanus polymorphus TaxID=672921 RepID=UPI003DA236C6